VAEVKNSRPTASLTIGGSDNGGGAGIQADLRMFDRLGVRGCSVTTALTAQNPQRVYRIEATPLPQLQAELDAVFDYFDVAVVKTGMLLDQTRVHAIAQGLQRYHADKPLVIDPVIISSSGSALLDDAGLEALKQTLLPQATLITPNLQEAATLLGQTCIDDPLEAASALAMRYHAAVLLKGGHGSGAQRHDFLYTLAGDVHVFSHPAQTWSIDQAHGTGCRLASAITAKLSQQQPLAQACQQAIKALQRDIASPATK
jgi:hydroxymethylpyrimidine/phosphomethylpyrimidine kinase